MDLTLVTCNYDTPELVTNLLRSVKQTCLELPKVLVMDTGPEPHRFLSNNGINYIRTPNTSHGVAVNVAMEAVDTKYILLVDSDVIFLRDFAHPFNVFKNKELTLMGEVVGDRGGKLLYPRVNPWYCFMDVETLKQHGILFLDKRRAFANKPSPDGRLYDIGSMMFEDVVNAGLKIGDAKMEDKYFKHYEGMSWRVQKYNPNDVDTDIDNGGTHPNKALYEYGLKVREQYDRETEFLSGVDIQGIFQ